MLRRMSELIHHVSFAVQRLSATGRVATLSEIRDLIVSEFGDEAAHVDLRAALLKLHGPHRFSTAAIELDSPATCSPLPEGWIPLDQFRGR